MMKEFKNIRERSEGAKFLCLAYKINNWRIEKNSICRMEYGSDPNYELVIGQIDYDWRMSAHLSTTETNQFNIFSSYLCKYNWQKDL